MKIALYKIVDDIDQAGREIYYAMSFMKHDSPGRANLEAALHLLGIHKPKDVGLSDSVLTRNNQ